MEEKFQSEVLKHSGSSIQVSGHLVGHDSEPLAVIAVLPLTFFGLVALETFSMLFCLLNTYFEHLFLLFAT